MAPSASALPADSLSEEVFSHCDEEPGRISGDLQQRSK